VKKDLFSKACQQAAALLRTAKTTPIKATPIALYLKKDICI
jgi:hypothetical protein